MTLSAQLLNAELLFPPDGSRHSSGVGIQTTTGWADGREGGKKALQGSAVNGI